MTVAAAGRTVLIAACLAFSGEGAAQSGKAGAVRVLPSNVAPARDARGIPVISGNVVAPAGWNQLPRVSGMSSYDWGKLRACTRSVTDRCLQTYEKGMLGRLPRCPGHPSCRKPEG